MSIWYWMGISAVIAVVVAIVLVRMTLRVVNVKGDSMSPTLRNGEQVLALRYWPSRWLKRGQLVLAYASLGPTRQSGRSHGHPATIKRIVGLPGDTVDNRDFVPGLERVDAHSSPLPPPPEEWHVPSGHLFICGDNRSASLDSRRYGPLSFTCVEGIVLMRMSS